MPKRNGKAMVSERFSEVDPEEIELRRELKEAEEEAAEAENIADFVGKFTGQPYKVRIEVLGDDKVYEHVTTVGLEGFDPYETCERIGPGRYQLSVINEHGKFVKGGRMHLRVSKLAAKPEPKAEEPKRDDSETTKLLMAAMQQSNAQMMEIVKAIAGRPEPQKEPASAMLDMLIKMKGLEGKPDDPLKELTKSLLPILLERALNPEKPDGDSESIAGQLKDVLEAAGYVGPLLEKFKGVRQLQLPQRPAQAQVPSKETPAVTPIADLLRSYVPQFVRYAKRGDETVEDAADELVSELSEEIVPCIVANYKPLGLALSSEAVWTELVKRSQDPAQVEAIFTSAPELAPYREWVAKVIAEAVKQVTKPEEKTEADADGN